MLPVNAVHELPLANTRLPFRLNTVQVQSMALATGWPSGEHSRKPAASVAADRKMNGIAFRLSPIHSWLEELLPITLQGGYN
jgi:hypothetical protein